MRKAMSNQATVLRSKYCQCYILDDKHEAVPERNIEHWSIWMAASKHMRIVGQITFNNGLYLSTVFLGMNHNFTDKGTPILFETMLFLNGKSLYQMRHSTWKQAEGEFYRLKGLITSARGPGLLNRVIALVREGVK